MAYFRIVSSQLASMGKLFNRDEDWGILIMADPDALASALALKRLMRDRVRSVSIAYVNRISRPDNLAMIRYLHIPALHWKPELQGTIQRFAMVDSQPEHSPFFPDVEYSLLIDHHPPQGTGREESSKSATTRGREDGRVLFRDIRPSYGAVSTMMTEYLYGAGIRPGHRLATALQYGIRTDTGTFARHCTEIDLRAYQYLGRFADAAILEQILRSEYLPGWLPYFSRAIESMKDCGRGSFAWLGSVASADLLVVVADFFLKVHGMHWIAVCGKSRGRLVVIFRGGDERMDLGAVASLTFEGFGSGGGHAAMARAEMALADVPRSEKDAEDFTFRRVRDAFESCRKGGRGARKTEGAKRRKAEKTEAGD